ncbi:MAG: hypothetical protein UX71_C0002G0221 [Parcubacteria group bacterium GW2011_GWA1_47_10]|uniref:Uncharacterized protein n=1 Tax=Candidatus Zambryskibacteria bacterium RIFCSPHIGHO2_01_FULL_46_25 TaxID=1802738 RepID=A0A1G2SYF5_9BACT|nr:MAG: hypothetical protein UX71_C0002G0221 [Parcubacteria group bacterium GW2011_GWA1_47_10]OHA90066.1 MAG: hypothetical protein A2838_00300 [Candidatus Zambryskibacteria bacterium RIFCSPHIGHO2_01_FULL_46_25]OHB06559.1 MAG: hypothetical protein A3A31_02955 [Candidatus Zambryskibacteria bacterium RIFCSPLOWO2_01_FULL_48_25]
MDRKLAQEIIDELAPYRRNTGAVWGIEHDFVDKIPNSRIGVSFYEMDHEQIEDFLNADDKEKFDMAYWAERYREKVASRHGFYIGISVGIIITIIFFSVVLSG